MPVIQGITLSLFAFAIAGFVLTLFAPAPDANPATQATYAVVISSGTGLRLTTRAAADQPLYVAQPDGTNGSLAAPSQTPGTNALAQPAIASLRQLTCNKVTAFAGIDIGTQCKNMSIEIAAHD